MMITPPNLIAFLVGLLFGFQDIILQIFLLVLLFFLIIIGFAYAIDGRTYDRPGNAGFGVFLLSISLTCGFTMFAGHFLDGILV